MEKYQQNYPNTAFCRDYHKHLHYHFDIKWLTLAVGLVELIVAIILINKAW